MKLAVLSDIHANWPALEAFMEHAAAVTSLDGMICLGDTAGYGASPAECIRFISGRAKTVIRGNHERMLLDPSGRDLASSAARLAIDLQSRWLTPGDMDIVRSWPDTAISGQLFLCHGSITNPDAYILTPAGARNALEELSMTGASIGLFGHTHIPAFYPESGRNQYEAGKIFHLPPGQNVLINPGSIGQPRDGDPRGSYCVVDTDNRTVIYERFQYDVQRAAESIRQRGLPDILAARLYFGR